MSSPTRGRRHRQKQARHQTNHDLIVLEAKWAPVVHPKNMAGLFRLQMCLCTTLKGERCKRFSNHGRCQNHQDEERFPIDPEVLLNAKYFDIWWKLNQERVGREVIETAIAEMRELQETDPDKFNKLLSVWDKVTGNGS